MILHLAFPRNIRIFVGATMFFCLTFTDYWPMMFIGYSRKKASSLDWDLQDFLSFFLHLSKQLFFGWIQLFCLCFRNHAIFSCFAIAIGWWFETWNLFSILYIRDVIPTPLTKSIIFQDGYCTSNQNYSISIIIWIIFHSYICQLPGVYLEYQRGKPTGWWFGTFFSISYMACHPSHWRTPSFFKMVTSNQQPANGQPIYIYNYIYNPPDNPLLTIINHCFAIPATKNTNYCHFFDFQQSDLSAFGAFCAFAGVCRR